MRIAIISNVNQVILEKSIADEHNVFTPSGYGVWLQELINFESNLYQFKPEIVFCILDGQEMLKVNENSYQESLNEINNYIQYLEKSISSNQNIIFFISDIDIDNIIIRSASSSKNEIYLEFNWYKNLYDLTTKYSNVNIFNIKKIVEQVGKKNFYSRKLWYTTGTKYSLNGIEMLKKEILNSIKLIASSRKKCLVLDLDNTLWGGVIGEDGINGIELSSSKEGSRYYDFQKSIKYLKETGVMLAINSKNNLEDVLEVFDNHPFMVLNKDDFVAIKVNWNSKSQNIVDLSNELNISEDSIVFIDDNPVERELIKTNNPLVTVPDFPTHTETLPDFMQSIYIDYFNIIKITDEDKNKTEMYKSNYQRAVSRKNTLTEEEYLKSLETRIQIEPISQQNLSRVVQLINKTNQFNLTTKRYNEIDIRRMQSESNHVFYVISVMDKFGDNGYTSVVIINRLSNEIVEIDNFVMSCRIMGRYIEDSILSFIENMLYEKGYKKIKARYIATQKNIPVRYFFDRMGYSIISEDDKEVCYLNELEKNNNGKRRKNIYQIALNKN